MMINDPFVRDVRNELYNMGKTTAVVNLLIENNFKLITKAANTTSPDAKAIAIAIARTAKNLE